MPILDTLFGAAGARAFRTTPWPTDAVIHHGRRARLPGFLRNGGELSDLEQLSFSYDGRCTVSGERGARQTSYEVRGTDPTNLVHDGLTVRLDDVIACVAPLAAWLAALETEIGIPAGRLHAVVFASPRGKRSGLSPHFDPTDNLIIQLVGTKRLLVSETPRVAYPSTQWNPGHLPAAGNVLDFAARTPPRGPVRARTVTLRPGSVAYVPAGVWHASQALSDSFSLSLSFGWPRRIDLLLAALRGQLLHRPEWRQPAYGAWRDGGRDVAVDGLIAAAARDLAQLGERDLAFAVDTGYQRLDRARRFYRTPTATVTFAAARGKPGHRVATIRSQQGQSRTTSELEPRFVAPFTWVAARRGTFAVGELLDALPRTSPEVVRELLAQLTQARLIQPVLFKASPPPAPAPAPAVAHREARARRPRARGSDRAQPRPARPGRRR
jgi:cupin superfamily protein